MQRSLTYSLGFFAIACVFATTPVFAQESTTSDLTQQTPKLGVQAQGDWAKKLMEQYQAFVAKKMGGMGSTTAKAASMTKMTSGSGQARTLGMRFWNASTSASTTECVQKAVDTRESALGTAWTTFNTAVSDALLDRQEALFNAWEIASTSERSTALKSAWKTWKTAHKDATSAFKTSRNTAWKTYRTTMVSTCKVIVPREESLEKDSIGSVSI